jgi:uncharacterized protein YbjQ (UPF0145 family)
VEVRRHEKRYDLQIKDLDSGNICQDHDDRIRIKTKEECIKSRIAINAVLSGKVMKMKSTTTIPEDEVGSVIRMIDNSRKSNTRAVIDISFSNVQRNGNIAELLAYLTAVKMKGEE